MMKKVNGGHDARGCSWTLYEHDGNYFFSDDTFTLACVGLAEGAVDPKNFDPMTYEGAIGETTEDDLKTFGLTKNSVPGAE